MTARKPRRYAEDTDVPVGRSREELDQLLVSRGAQQRMIGHDDQNKRAFIQFAIDGRQIRLIVRVDTTKLPNPVLNSEQQQKKVEVPRGWNNWDGSERKQYYDRKYAQLERETWRRLVLLTKAKFEQSADEGIEQVFLANVVMTDGQTVYEFLQPQIKTMYESGSMPPLLPAHSK